ncbi:MAG: DUF4347 domain-containing protein, partial [Pseudomonas stutzeri]|nr:DUF4347 domain-containing protein [Stutzerimonas stutzeri]
MSKMNKTNQSEFRRKPLIMALESRILLDGAMVVTAAEALSDVDLQTDAVHGQSAEQSMHFAAPAPTNSEAPARREVAFVDTSVAGYESLLAELGTGVETILIDGSENGLEQMVAALQGLSNIDALHVLSHGSLGELRLGSLTLNADNLQDNAGLLSALGQSLSQDADLMLYGCNVGAEQQGRGFIDALAGMTGADVAASDDLTGAARLGGDWELEAESGVVETLALSLAGFDGVLAPTVSAVADSVTYTEGGEPVRIDTGITFTGGGDYREGYIRFTVENPTAGDQFVLQDAADVNAVGAISVQGNDVYLGNGVSRERIGSIDSVENGVNGKALKILLSTPLPNAGFEDGSAHWTLSSEIYGDGVGEINFDNYLIPLAVNVDGDSNYTGGTGTTNVQASNGFKPQASIRAGVGVEDTQALYLSSSGSITRVDQDPPGSFKQNGYGSIHGPYATSTVIKVEKGDSISLDFRAVGSGDDYEVFGMLRQVDGEGNFLSDNVNNAANIILFAERGADTKGYVRVDYTGLTAGDYRFQFVGGTYDGSGGLVVGSNLYVDNIRLISSNVVNDTIGSQIASQVTYQSTADDTEAERDITISARDSAGGTGSDTITLIVEQRNNAPVLSGDGTLSPVNEDTLSPSGSTVGNLFDSLFADPDTAFTPGDYLSGIIITADGSDPARGQWQYTTDGSTWYALGEVATNNGLLLSRDASLRFVPVANFNGAPRSLSAHAVDSSDSSISFTSGADRQIFDTSAAGVTGGNTAVSSAAVRLNTSITAVDDAPILEQPASQTITDTDQLDTFTELSGTLAASDIDTLAADLRYGIDGGQSLVADVALVGAYGTLRVVRATGEYTYTPDSAAINALTNAQVDNFTVTVTDGTSTVSKTLSFNINGANDAPVFGTITEVDDGKTPPDLSGGVAPGAGVESLDNGLLRFGSNAQDSINAMSGMLEQPFYYDNGGALKLTFYNYGLNMALGANGDGTSDWNLNGVVNLEPEFSNITVDTSGFSNGSGTLVWRGEITIDGAQLAVTHVYELPVDSAYIETRTYITNIGLSVATNLRIWMGTQDDYIAGTDAPAKLKGNLVGGAFEANSGIGQQGKAIKVYSGDTAVLFYSTSEKADTIIGQLFGWTTDYPEHTPAIDPSESAFDQGPDDGGYALYVRMDDLASGETQSFDWFYAAGSTQQIDAIIAQVSAAASANLVEGSGQLIETGQYVVSDVDTGDVVTLAPTAVTAGRFDAQGNPVALGSSMPDSAALLAMLSVTPTTVVDAASTSGTFSWNFDAGSEGFKFLGQGETLKLEYTLTAQDSFGATATQKVELIIEGINDAPVSQNTAESVNENGIFSGHVTATDVDGTIASYALVSSVASGSLSFNANGSYSFNPGTAFDDLKEGETRAVTFTYRATDNAGAASQVATVTLTVVGSNDVPVVSAGSATTSENGSITSSVPAASDVDGTIAGYQVVTGVTAGTLTFNTDGTYSFDPGADFDDLAVGQSRQVSFTYTATDNDGGVSAPGTVTITITGTNDAPTVDASATISGGTEDSAKDITYAQLLAATGAQDVDGDAISFRIETINSGQLKKDTGSGFVDVVAGVTLIGPGESLLWLADEHANGLLGAFTVRAVDAQGALSANTSAVSVVVAAVNDLVTITGKSSATLLEDSSILINGFTLTDVEGDDVIVRISATNGTLTLDDATGVTVTGPGGRELVFSGSLAAANAALNTLRYAGDADYFGQDELTITVSDDNGDSWQPYRVNEQGLFFNSLNGHYYEYISAPGLSWDAAKIAAEQRSLFGLDGYLATVTSQAENDFVTPRLGGDGWIGASDAEQEGIWRWVTGPEAGTQFWTGDTSAGTSATSTYGSSFNGGYANWAQSEPNNSDANRGGEDVAHFYASGANAGKWNDFAANNLGIQGYVVEYGGTGFGDLQAAKLQITILPVNDVPVVSPGSATADENGTIETNVPAATDIDGTIVGYQLVSGVGEANGSLIFNSDGSYSFDPGSDFDDLAVGESRQVTFTYTARDNEGGVSLPGTVTFTLTGTNDAPTISADASTPITEVPGDSSAQDLSDSGVIRFN